MLKLNLYVKTITTKDGRKFPTYFVGAKKGDKTVFMDARLTKSFLASHLGEQAVKQVESKHPVGLAFDGDKDCYFFVRKTDKQGNTIVGKDGTPLVRMVIKSVSRIIEPIELPKSEKREELHANDFFDTEDDMPF